MVWVMKAASRAAGRAAAGGVVRRREAGWRRLAERKEWRSTENENGRGRGLGQGGISGMIAIGSGVVGRKGVGSRERVGELGGRATHSY